MANQWFRMYSEFSYDPKVQMLNEIDQRRLVMLFCLRCNGNVTLQDEEVTFQLRISNIEWQITKATFIAKGFIDSDNEVLNWDKRQYASDSSAARVQRFRDKKKQECNVTVTPQNRTEQNRTEQKDRVVGTPAGAICLALKKNNVLDVNPSHPKLLALIEAGATIEEFEGAASEVSVKKFAYVMATVEGRRKDAKDLKLVKGKIEPKENLAWRNDDNQIFKKAKELGIATTGKGRFELLAKIDEKRGAI